jgi:hypothetical protein
MDFRSTVGIHSLHEQPSVWRQVLLQRLLAILVFFFVSPALHVTFVEPTQAHTLCIKKQFASVAKQYGVAMSLWSHQEMSLVWELSMQASAMLPAHACCQV